MNEMAMESAQQNLPAIPEDGPLLSDLEAAKISEVAAEVALLPAFVAEV